MILEEETFREFGYISSELKPQSCKKILASCDDCGKVRILRKDGYHAICKSCSQKGEKNHMFGTHLSEEMKKKLREARNRSTVFGNPRSEETKQKISEAHKGKKLSDEHKRKIGEAERGERNHNYGKHPSEETREKMREARKHQKFPKQHTKPERIWQEIVIDKHSLPFKYTGDGSFWIGKKPAINPDFIHLTKKIAVEIFSWHHNELQRHCKVRYSQTYEGRKKILKKRGYKMIVFWQEDLMREDAEAFVLSELRKEGVIK
jgi:very-short-patch-repair endonuclease